MKVALGQINPIVGDFAGNLEKMTRFVVDARRAAADLIVFPELSVCGYPPKDLLLKPSFVAANLDFVQRLANATKAGPPVLAGYVEPNPSNIGRPVFNAVAFLKAGEIAGKYFKSLLPTYDVFDEHRYFEPAEHVGLLDLNLGERSLRVGVTICEDLWTDGQLFARQLYRRAPIEEVSAGGAHMILNASASPYIMKKQAFREQLMGGHARSKGVPLLLSAQVGGNDELLFDGASMAFDATGRLIARAKAFEEDLLIVDFERPAQNRVEAYPEPVESVWQALVLGTRDYVGKCGFKDVVIGLSGGIDSAVVAAIATEALGSEHVHGVGMPSRYSSEHSIKDAEALAANLKIDFRLVPIVRIHEMIDDQLNRLFENRLPDATEENIQARARGNILMALSNKFGWLLLTTGNKSEVAVGYCTLYGDMAGGLAVISDVPKTMVYQLARHANAQADRTLIPESTLTKAPSAELRPNQTDQDTLPPYDVLDAILQEYVEQERSAADIIAMGFNEAVVRDVVRRVDRNEYKRQQMPIGLKVTSRAFGIGRRMPIAARFDSA
ncbi:MAG TPA: NAD+ synthase [Phycisphaerae bacterium]|nr:NAD+ synthase [Phycisphaerae bacterium]